MSTQARTEFKNDVAAMGEQFRKTTEAASEQTRQTFGAAQERIQENLARVQQAQSDWAKTMLRLTEQSGQFATVALTSMWDASFAFLKLATWGQEQTERSLVRVAEQNRVTRDEGMALLNETADQTRRNQNELYRLSQENLRVGLFYAGKAGRRESETAKPPVD